MLKWAVWESFEFLVFSFEFKKKSETKDYSPTTKDFFRTGLFPAKARSRKVKKREKSEPRMSTNWHEDFLATEKSQRKSLTTNFHERTRRNFSHGFHGFGLT